MTTPVANNPLNTYNVLADVVVVPGLGNTQIQYVKLDIGAAGTSRPVTELDPLPVSGSFTPTAPSLPTLTPSRVECTSGASIEVLAANGSRVSGAMIINNTDQSFFLQIAAAAVVGQGIPLPPGGIWQVNTEQQVRAIYTSSGTAFLDIYEAT